MSQNLSKLINRNIQAGALSPIAGIVQLVSGEEPIALNIDTITNALIVETDRTWAAIFDLVIYRWVNAKIGINAAPTILSDGPSGDQPGIYYDLLSNEVVLLVQYCVDIETVGDWLDFEIGYINEAAAFIPVTPKRRIFTALAQATWGGLTTTITPSIAVRYSTGARRITMRAQTNDAAASVTLSWQGYILKV